MRGDLDVLLVDRLLLREKEAKESLRSIPPGDDGVKGLALDFVFGLNFQDWFFLFFLTVTFCFGGAFCTCECDSI